MGEKTKYKDIRVIVIDNYDSFTYNLVHVLEEVLGRDIVVMRNDKINYKALDDCTHIVLSPGPGIPEEAGDLKAVIKKYHKTKNIFGVCLGLQAIGEVFGGSLINLDKVYHGVSTMISLTSENCPIFKEIIPPFEAGRYHSWVIDNADFPDNLSVTAVDENGEIMAAHHREFSVYGVQFRPESIMTPNGKAMIKNFLEV